MDKIKNQLASIVTLIGLIGAIGAGFVKYGEINEKINSMSVVDTSGLEKQQVINVEKIIAFEQNINTNSFSINDNRNAVDELQKSTNKLNSELEKEIKILQKEIELLKVQIEEIKISSSNPLAN